MCPFPPLIILLDDSLASRCRIWYHITVFIADDLFSGGVFKWSYFNDGGGLSKDFDSSREKR